MLVMLELLAMFFLQGLVMLKMLLGILLVVVGTGECVMLKLKYTQVPQCQNHCPTQGLQRYFGQICSHRVLADVSYNYLPIAPDPLVQIDGGNLSGSSQGRDHP